MKSICYIVPYFGKLPENFQLWLLGCKFNPTVDWIIYTDDRRKFDYPQNVKVKYCSFEEIKKRIQSFYDFKVDLSRPWRLALMKSAYGEIFKDDLTGYDFWGYCDIDLMWGNIRAFYTDKVLQKYERIGYQGHSTLFPNDAKLNLQYRTIIPDHLNYIDVFSGKCDFSWDESGMNMVYWYFNKKPLEFRKVCFAHLDKYNKGFFLKHRPKEEYHLNNRQILKWENGKLTRHSLVGDQIIEEELMYVHFWCRPMKYKVKDLSGKTPLYIYPDVMTDKQIGISAASIRKYGTRSKISFLIDMAWKNRHKFTLKKIIFNLKKMKEQHVKNYKKV